MSRISRRPALIARLLAAALSLAVVEAQAVVLAGKSMPTQRQLVASQNNVLSVGWQVAVSPDHNTGVNSPAALIVNPSTGATLATVAGTLSKPGSGPFLFSETIELSEQTVRGWQQQGIRRLLLRRQFNDAMVGGGPTAQVVLTLASSGLRAQREAPSNSLALQRLDLSFSDRQRMQVVRSDEELRALLRLSYSGSGLLEGHWQIAEPGSTEGRSFYRTLSMVRQHLGSSQSATLNSPLLPVNRAGKYRLRFCITNQAFIPSDALVLDAGCPVEKLSAEVVYQVTGNDALGGPQMIEAGPERGEVSAATRFHWQPVAGAVIYQLQLFEQGSEQAVDGEQLLGHDNGLVAGMLLPAGDREARLSPLVLSKLKPGRQYLWRITAHDQDGALAGRSQARAIRYTPAQ